MTRVLIFSHTTGYQLRAFNDAAAALGIDLLFATDCCHKLDDPWRDRAIAVRFYDLHQSLATIASRVHDAPVDGVIAVGDQPVLLAAGAAQALGVPWHSVSGALASIDKRQSRTALAIAGLPSPRFTVRKTGLPGDSGSTMRDPGATISDSRSAIGDQGFAYPVVLKPVGLSGSRGVIRANDAAEYAAAVTRIEALLARPQVRASRLGLDDEILVEQYIAGREFALEGVLRAGALRVLALFDKPDPLEGPFFEETVYVTPSRAPEHVQARIVARVADAARALGLTHGPVHAECRVTASGDVYVLEVAGRPIGGLCSRVLSFVGPDGRPVSLETVLLEHAVGRSIEGFAREGPAAAVMMIPIPRRGIFKGTGGEKSAREVAGVTEVRITAKEGQLLEPLPEGGSYLGFIFARGSSPAEAERSVRGAHARLEFSIARELTVAAG